MKDYFKVIGYYICEINDTPGWLQGISRQILSVSGCIGEQHPRWDCFMGGWSKGEAREYQEKLRLDREHIKRYIVHPAVNHDKADQVNMVRNFSYGLLPLFS